MDPPEADYDGGVRASLLAPAVSADAGALAASASGAQLIWVGVPVWSSSGDASLNNGYCRGIRYVAAETPEAAEALREQAELEYVTLWTTIFVVEAPGTLPDVDCPVNPAELIPASVLRDAVRDSVIDQLPRPTLEVPPGWALTGMPAFLVTNHALSYGPATHTLDLGEIRATVDITAHGTTWVDWGDGTVTTHQVPGTPWPDGQIVHTYRDAVDVVVRVTDHWRVDFTVTSPATITDAVDAILDPRVLELEVRQIQAVRTAPIG